MRNTSFSASVANYAPAKPPEPLQNPSRPRWSGSIPTKPDEFYEIVRAASYLPFGEVFGRKPREGFVNLYQEAVKDVSKAAA